MTTQETKSWTARFFLTNDFDLDFKLLATSYKQFYSQPLTTDRSAGLYYLRPPATISTPFFRVWLSGDDNIMSNCLSCTAPIMPCNCTATQSCLLTVRTCDTCNIAFCQEKSIPSSPASSTPSSLGTTIGGALGGVLGILVVLALIYFFWWKPRGLAASRRRYSRHLESRQSKRMSMTAVGGNLDARESMTAGRRGGRIMLTTEPIDLLERTSLETERAATPSSAVETGYRTEAVSWSFIDVHGDETRD